MAATDIYFGGMTEKEMRRFAEQHPGRVNKRDRYGDKILYSALFRNKSFDLVTWLVDEKGADVHARSGGGATALFFATSVDMLSFLLDRGADPTVRDASGMTALFTHTRSWRTDYVARLLQDERVVATIDTALICAGDLGGCSTLHAACYTYLSDDAATRIVELLLLHDADPFLRDAYGRTPLDILRKDWLIHHTTIARLERAMAEPQRTFSLSKARHMNDANHAINKAKAAADEEEEEEKHALGEKMRKILAKTPPYLKERVEEDQVDLPRVELVQPSDENEGEKKMVAVMKYVLRDQAEYGEMGGMSADVFVELLEMMAPNWDAIRGGGGGGGAGGVGGEGGGGH